MTDCHLQPELRRYVRCYGSARKRGSSGASVSTWTAAANNPCKTNDPEAALAVKRAMYSGSTLPPLGSDERRSDKGESIRHHTREVDLFVKFNSPVEVKLV